MPFNRINILLTSARDRLSELTKKSITELMQIYGIGRTKASAIYALLN
jgi:DNA repair protein RadC